MHANVQIAAQIQLSFHCQAKKGPRQSGILSELINEKNIVQFIYLFIYSFIYLFIYFVFIYLFVVSLYHWLCNSRSSSQSVLC